MIKPSFSQKSACGLKFILDKTEPLSGPGKNALKHATFFSRENKERLLIELENVDRLRDAVSPRAREVTQLESVFFHLKDLKNTFSRLGHSTLDEVELFEMKSFLSLTRQASDLTEALSLKFGLEGLAFRNTDKAYQLLEANKGGDGFFLAEGLSERLRLARQKKNDASRLMAAASDIRQLEEAKRRHLAAAAEEDAAEEEVRALLSTALRPYAEDFAHNSDVAAGVDLLLAKARLAYSTGASKPSVCGEKLILKGLFNPEIKERLLTRGSDFSPISIEAEKGVTLITGANMGGKSVALKTIALNVLLAHLGFFVYAEEAVIPLFDFVELLNENMQSVEKGLSTFGGEIVRVNALLGQLKSGQFGLSLIDEFAGGTNFEEGGRIFRAVERALNDLEGISVMTTHFDGVSDDAGALYQVKGLSGVDLSKLDSEIEGGADGVELIGRYMDYGLVEVKDKRAGVPKDAVTVCRLLRLDTDVLKDI